MSNIIHLLNEVTALRVELNKQNSRVADLQDRLTSAESDVSGYKSTLLAVTESRVKILDEVYQLRAQLSEQPADSVQSGPAEIEVCRWFQESTINHHIEEDGSHISKRAMFIAKKSWDAALQSVEISGESDEPIDYVLPYVSEKGLDGYTATLNPFKEGRYTLPVYLQPIANNSETSQRITEKDAREIAESYYIYMINAAFEYPVAKKANMSTWIEGRGRTLLAKLNEHREPAGHDLGNLWHLKNSEDELMESENVDVLHKAVFNLWEDIRCLKETISELQVTPNKAEVPQIITNEVRYTLRNAANELMGVSNILWDGIPEESREIHRKYMREYSRYIDAFLDSLPPLKDD